MDSSKPNTTASATTSATTSATSASTPWNDTTVASSSSISSSTKRNQKLAFTLTNQLLNRSFIQSVESSNATTTTFITPSLLCSNQNPFTFMQQNAASTAATTSATSHLSIPTMKNNINNNNNGSNRNINHNDNNNNNNSSNPHAFINNVIEPLFPPIYYLQQSQNESNIPSIIGMNIHTSLQLLYSIYYMEQDYYPHLKKEKKKNGSTNNHHHQFQKRRHCSYKSILPIRMKMDLQLFAGGLLMEEQLLMSDHLKQKLKHEGDTTGNGNSNAAAVDDGGGGGNNKNTNNNGENTTLTHKSASHSSAGADGFNNGTRKAMSHHQDRNVQLLLHRFRHEDSNPINININHTNDNVGNNHDNDNGGIMNDFHQECHDTVALLTYLVLDSTPYNNNNGHHNKNDDHHDDDAIMTKTSMNWSMNEIPKKYKTTFTPPSTTNNSDDDHYNKAQTLLNTKYQHIPKRVCQHPFSKNDIVWVCRTCQADETCVLCHECYIHSNHEGHDVSFYHAQAGGCCDCGDEDAWDPKGFCHVHGHTTTSSSSCGVGGLEPDVEWKVRGIVHSCVQFIGDIGENVSLAYERANGGKIIHEKQMPSLYTRQESLDSDTIAISTTSTNNTTEKGRRLPSSTSLVGTKRKNDISISSDVLMEEDEDGAGGANDYSSPTDTFMGENGNYPRNDDKKWTTSLSLSFHECPNDSDDDNNFTGETMDVDMVKHEEFKFDPNAASTSKSRNNNNNTSSPSTPDSFKSAFSSHIPDSGKGRDQYDDTATDTQQDYESFNPEEASKSKSHNKHQCSPQQTPISPRFSPAHQLGLLGLQQDGLYLILHADDVTEEIVIGSALKMLYQSFSPFAPPSALMSQIYYNGKHKPPNINMEMVSSMIPKLFSNKDSDIGDIIVWGTFELMEELGPVMSQCWKDGDANACSRFGALMLDKADILRKNGLVVSIKTRAELSREIRALAVLEFLKMLSDCCDPLCNLVSLSLGGYNSEEALLSKPSSSKANKVHDKGDFRGDPKHLKSMLNSDLKLPRLISQAWHDLLLKLLAVPIFKAALSNAYVDTYSHVASEYAKGVGVLNQCHQTLSVQFLNRITYVQNLVKNKDLLGCLVRSLFDTINTAKLSSDFIGDENKCFNDRLDISHSVLSHRRYMPAISDMKCVLNVPGIAHLFSSIPRQINMELIATQRSCLDAWIKTLAITQNMDPQVWRTFNQGHIELESEKWITAFNLSISLGSLFERLLLWKDCDRNADNFDDFPLTFLSVIELTEYVIINGLEGWQRKEMNELLSMETKSKDATELQERMCLHVPKVAVQHGCLKALNVLPILQNSRWSFHIPLHRFVSSCLREIARRPYQVNAKSCGIDELFECLGTGIKDDLKLGHFYNGLVEVTTTILSRAAQIRSDLWKRNGNAMKLQVINYAEPSFCKSMRDADLLLIQFSLIGNSMLHVGGDHESIMDAKTNTQFNPASFICLLIYRFGLFDFVGFEAVAEEYMEDGGFEVAKYPLQSSDGLVTDERRRLSAMSDTISHAKHALQSSAFSASDDPERLSAMLNEFLHLLIILITELPPPQCYSESEHLEQAKLRLRREVVHRLVSGPKAHSDLSEVNHVLPLHDNVVLSEEGKFVNPEDAGGAALEAVLVQVADCKSTRGNSDQWVLQRWAWNEYDPAFYHISTPSHQNAAEKRPMGTDKGAAKSANDAESYPYAPFPPQAHGSFSRLRHDITANATLIAILYRVLHSHCHDVTDTPGVDFMKDIAYNTNAQSERVIARAIHLLTLGAYAWDDTDFCNSKHTVEDYDRGSIFYNSLPPNQQNWVETVFLGSPVNVMGNMKYDRQETLLELLDQLARKGGSKRFKVEDKAIRNGAAWLCDYAIRSSSKAAALLRGHSQESKVSIESDLQRRKREAKERAQTLMQEKMAKFEDVLRKNNEYEFATAEEMGSTDVHRTKPSENLDKFTQSDVSDLALTRAKEENEIESTFDQPQCIICGDGSVEATLEGEGNGEKVLAFCALLQPSTVLKSSGIVHTNEDKNTSLVGTYISLCGHAVHTSCCESHLKDIVSSETFFIDRNHSEFRCPLCRQLSNCLVPHIGVGSKWTDPLIKTGNFSVAEASSITCLHEFLSQSTWWAMRNDKSVIWDGRCNFYHFSENKNNSVGPRTRKDLVKKWESILNIPIFSSTSIPSIPLENDADHSNNATLTEVFKRLLDTMADLSYRTDVKRLGEERLLKDFGEFRHYLVEKNVFNEENQMLGIGPSSWPTCLTFIPPESRSTISKEKLLSKLFSATQTFTYSCCSEEVEFKRQLNVNPMSMSELKSKFGINLCSGGLLTLQSPTSDKPGNKDIFHGKIGRLRYLALPLMTAIGPVAREMVQISLSFPVHQDHLSEYYPRAPIAFPLLYGHVLTHVVTAMIASCGSEGIKHRECASSLVIDEDGDMKSGDTSFFETSMYIQACIHFIQLGYIAKVLQTALAVLQKNSLYSPYKWRKYEKEILTAISILLTCNDTPLPNVERAILRLIQAALHNQDDEINYLDDDENNLTPGIPKVGKDTMLNAILKAKEDGDQFLSSACLILQILSPNSVSLFEQCEFGASNQVLYKMMNIDIEKMISSPLVRDIVCNWYNAARPSLEHDALKMRLQCKFKFNAFTWPSVSTYGVQTIYNQKKHGKTPLLQRITVVDEKIDHKSRIEALPTSYTDLYAEMSKFAPSGETSALCLVCGEVLLLDGKKECTIHAAVCGGGCGIFFFLQQSYVAIVKNHDVAIIKGPYVDSHGETPHYRGRPLFLDMSRYENLHELWASHTVRQRVVYERSNYSLHQIREIDAQHY